MIDCLETRIKSHKADRVTMKFGRDWSFHTEYSHTPNDKIWVGWKTDNVAVTILDFAAQLIYYQLGDLILQFHCLMIIICGLNTVAERKELWNHLKMIHTTVKEPCLVLGDFNVVLSADDRVNGNHVPFNETMDFQQGITPLLL